MPVFDKIKIFQKKLKAINDLRFQNSPTYPTLNVGIATTGTEATKNIIPNYCEIELDIRPIPGQNPEEIFEIFKNFLTDGLPEFNGLPVNIKLAKKFTPPMETPKHSMIVRAVAKISGKTTGSACFNTEGGVYNVHGSQTIIFGPGNIEQAHKPNEFIEEKYCRDTTIEMYKKLIKEICCKT